jgi:ribosomal protein S18 acetylase RimI-like enzyme
VARAFYRSQGYTELERISGYYQGTEDAVRLEKQLWPAVSERR